MEFYVAIGLDVTAVGILLYCTLAAAKKGFVRTVIQMIAYVGILLAASFLSRAAAPVVYDRVVEPFLLEQRGGSAGDRPGAALVAAAPRGMLLSVVDDALDGLRSLVPEDFEPPDGLPEPADGLIDEIADASLRPLMISAISMVGFALIFALLSLAANILLGALGIINRLPVIGTVNALLGGAVGILEGMLLVWMLAILLRGMLHFNPEGWWIFTRASVDRTWIFRFFMEPELLRNLIRP